MSDTEVLRYDTHVYMIISDWIDPYELQSLAARVVRINLLRGTSSRCRGTYIQVLNLDPWIKT